MIRILATALSALFATVGPETIEVRDGGTVDLTLFACNDTPRSTVVQRVCYDSARRYLLVATRGEFRAHCDVPAETMRALVTAPSMGQFYRTHIEPGGTSRFACPRRPR